MFKLPVVWQIVINTILTLIVDHLKNANSLLLPPQFILSYHYLIIFQGEAKKPPSPISANVGVHGGKKIVHRPLIGDQAISWKFYIELVIINLQLEILYLTCN